MADESETTFCEESTIENDIRQFVACKIGERVFLHLSPQHTVSIKHVRKSGSTVLAIFWMKVLQHPNNYPVQNFPYRKLYKGSRTGEDRVTLTVDGVKVTVFMTSGMLQISGQFAIEWFVDRFRGMMSAYVSSPSSPKPLRQLFTDAQTTRLMDEKRRLVERYKDWPDEALKETTNVVRDGERWSEEIERREHPRLPDMVTDEHVYIQSDPDLLSTDELTAQVERLKAGTSMEGHVMHRLWKSLINSWFADDTCQVYIVTPRLDADRLASICRLHLNNRLTANLTAICVPIEFSNTKMSDVKHEAMRRFPPKDQVMIEHKVFDAIAYPQKNYQAKFIAAVKDGEASVLLTTADFHGDQFLQSCTCTAVYQILDESDFMMRYLGPILSSANTV